MENLKFHDIWVALEMKICFLRQSWKNIVDKFTKVSKIDVWNVSQYIFRKVLTHLSEIWLLGGRLGTCHQSQTFQVFS